MMLYKNDPKNRGSPLGLKRKGAFPDHYSMTIRKLMSTVSNVEFSGLSM